MTTNARGMRAAGGMLTLLAFSGTLVAAGSVSQPGSYRPVEGRDSSGNAQGRFPPVQDRTNAQRWTANQPLPSPVLPQQPRTPTPRYLPGGYGMPIHSQPGLPQPAYGPTAPSPDSYSWNPPPLPDPGSLLGNFFGTHHNNAGGVYLPPPGPPLTPPVAPVYNPPVPAAPLQPPLPAGYGYGYPGQPQAPATYSAQPQAPASYSGQQHWPQPSGSMPAPHPQAPSASRQAATPTTPGKAAPRPFSNPQESGSSFTPRAITIQPGRHDSRFRPPELKGTP